MFVYRTGQPATVFNEGENFSFQFSIKNNTDESVPFHDYNYLMIEDFFCVKTKKENYGKPFDFTHHNPTKELQWLFANGYSFFEVPWSDEREEFKLGHNSFKSLKKEPLKSGKYYTKFSYNFTFGVHDNNSVIETGKLTFKINFKIK